MVNASSKDCVKEEKVIRTSSISSYSEKNNNGMNSTTIDDDDDINNDTDNKEENKSLVSVLEDPCCDENNTNEEEETKEESSFMKKTATAVAGGAIVGVGLVMIPLPGPGALIVGGGMALLGTEFPAVQRVLGDTCNSVADAIERRITSSSETITQEEKESCQEEVESNIPEKQQQQQSNNHSEKKHVQEETTSNFDVFTNLGKKAIPVIRKLGEGVDKERLDAQTASILSTAEIPLEAASKGVCQLWRQIFVLDDDEDLMTPFQYKEKVDSIQ